MSKQDDCRVWVVRTMTDALVAQDTGPATQHGKGRCPSVRHATDTNHRDAWIVVSSAPIQGTNFISGTTLLVFSEPEKTYVKRDSWATKPGASRRG
jgi:hypothetical protein